LRWRRIKLNANIAKAPKDVRDQKTSPGLALVFVAAQHPGRIKATDYKTRFGWYVPGLECTVHGGEPWRYVPCVRWPRGDAHVELDARWRSNDFSHSSVPILRE